jgi:diacylglycerol kinase family enzyme
MKIFFLLNPSRPRKLRHFRALAQQSAQRLNHTPYFGDVDRLVPDSMERLLTQALDHGCARLVALGGDGTYNRLIRWLAAKHQLATMEVGLVPGGTCNDFVRARRFPRRLSGALRLACGGPAVETDVGELNGELFLNNAGFGRRLGSAPRRKLNAFRTLRQFEPVPLRAAWDQGRLAGSFYMGLVCNSPFFSKGLYFSKDVKIDDGLLDIFLVPKMPKAKLAAKLLLGRLGRPLGGRQFVTLRLKQLVIESERDLWPQVDGEPASAEPVRQLRFNVSPFKALIVRPV